MEESFRSMAVRLRRQNHAMIPARPPGMDVKPGQETIRSSDGGQATRHRQKTTPFRRAKEKPFVLVYNRERVRKYCDAFRKGMVSCETYFGVGLDVSL